MVFWESRLSIFWLKSVWDLCACGQHAVNFLFGGSLVSDKKTSRVWFKTLSIAFEEELEVLDFAEGLPQLPKGDRSLYLIGGQNQDPKDLSSKTFLLGFTEIKP